MSHEGLSVIRACRLFAVWLVIIFLVSGCFKVGPDFVRPKATVSPGWLDAGDERVKTEVADYRNWWQAFNDPVLNKLIDRA